MNRSSSCEQIASDCDGGWRTLVDVRAVGLLPGLGALLLLARGSGGLLAGFLLLSRSLSGWCLAGSGWGLRGNESVLNVFAPDSAKSTLEAVFGAISTGFLKLLESGG